jgi:hypothetical protein
MKARTRKGRSNWFRAAVALGAIGAIAVATPAIGGPSLKKLVKKEVRKQIRKATGPRGPIGPQGPTGAAGADGAPGTARAYASVLSHVEDDCTGGCTFSRDKGITAVTREGTGDYCVTVPGISDEQIPSTVSVDWSFTADPEGNATAQPRNTGDGCPGGTAFEVRTERHTDTSPAVPADDVSFNILIP